jgi:hypothetical protein
MIKSVLEFSIPVWAVLCVLLGMIIGSTWQFFRNRAETNRLIQLVAELTHELSKHVDSSNMSPLANAIRTFKESADKAMSGLKIPTICRHFNNFDDCPVCRH